jgi:hypothetical protein
VDIRDENFLAVLRLGMAKSTFVRQPRDEYREAWRKFKLSLMLQYAPIQSRRQRKSAENLNKVTGFLWDFIDVYPVASEIVKFDGAAQFSSRSSLAHGHWAILTQLGIILREF